MVRVYTKTGDDGTTGQLFGGRIPKASELVEALGDIDEAVSTLGVARAACATLGVARAACCATDQSTDQSTDQPTDQPTRQPTDQPTDRPTDQPIDKRVAEILLRVQKELFIVGADLAVNPKHRDRLKPGVSLVEPEMVTDLEKLIDELTAERPLKPVFLVPGTTELEAKIDLARTVVRRAERHTLRAKDAGHTVSEHVQHYLNRLSDLVFVLARRAIEGLEEPVSHD